MGLSKTGTATQIPIPHEPGEWMAFRRLSAYELEERMKPGGDLASEVRDEDGTVRPWFAKTVGGPNMTMRERFDLCHKWLVACMTGWSYPDPFTEDNRLGLDAPTLLWAYETAVRHNCTAESLEEKKVDSPPSTAT